MPLVINWYTQIIEITSPTTSVAGQVLHDFIEDAMVSPIGLQHSDIIQPEGKIEDPSNPGVYSQIIIILNSPWQIQFWGGSGYTRIYGAKIVGGLADEPLKATGTAGDITVLESPVDGVTVVGGSGVTEQDKIDIAEKVWDDTDGVGLLENVEKILGVTYIKEAAIDDPSPSTTKFKTTFTESGTFWTRAALLFLDGQNAGLIRGIKNYNGVTKEIQVQTPLSFTPANGNKIIIIAARKFLTPDVLELADAVWANSNGVFVKAIEGGRWKIDKTTKQMTFYKEDNVTEVAKFNLFNSAGVLDYENVFERVRITTTTTTTTSTTTTTTV